MNKAYIQLENENVVRTSDSLARKIKTRELRDPRLPWRKLSTKQMSIIKTWVCKWIFNISFCKEEDILRGKVCMHVYVYVCV